jgi:hypothetical protein
MPHLTSVTHHPPFSPMPTPADRRYPMDASGDGLTLGEQAQTPERFGSAPGPHVQDSAGPSSPQDGETVALGPAKGGSGSVGCSGGGSGGGSDGGSDGGSGGGSGGGDSGSGGGGAGSGSGSQLPIVGFRVGGVPIAPTATCRGRPRVHLPPFRKRRTCGAEGPPPGPAVRGLGLHASRGRVCGGSASGGATARRDGPAMGGAAPTLSPALGQSPLDAPTLSHLFSFLPLTRRTQAVLSTVCKEWHVASVMCGAASGVWTALQPVASSSLPPPLRRDHTSRAQGRLLDPTCHAVPPPGALVAFLNRTWVHAGP